MGDLGLIPGMGRSPGEGTGYLLQYSGLENAMDCIVHGVAKSQTRLSKFHFHLVLLSIQKGECSLLLWPFCVSGRKTHHSDCSKKIILFTCMGWNWNINWKQKKKKTGLAFSYMSAPFSSAIGNILFAALLPEHVFHPFFSLSFYLTLSISLSACDCFSYPSFIWFLHNFALNLASHGLSGNFPFVQLLFLPLMACIWVTPRKQKLHWLL